MPVRAVACTNWVFSAVGKDGSGPSLRDLVFYWSLLRRWFVWGRKPRPAELVSAGFIALYGVDETCRTDRADRAWQGQATRA